jgi:hypothetical protein
MPADRVMFRIEPHRMQTWGLGDGYGSVRRFIGRQQTLKEFDGIAVRV